MDEGRWKTRHRFSVATVNAAARRSKSKNPMKSSINGIDDQENMINKVLISKQHFATILQLILMKPFPNHLEQGCGTIRVI